jgi:predicted short-subunit dehydrogenase-like oxidoreductase (DUF2520 family)
MNKTTLHYAILGDGRLAQHMRHYLELEGQRVSAWARNPRSDFNSHAMPDAEARLRATVRNAQRVLLLVSDGAIAALLRQYPFLHQSRLVHCAGALSLPGVAGAHPLMTFGAERYTHEAYAAVPFMVEQGHAFADLFPGLPNASYPIAPEQKALYHALCVTAGNFPQLLWQAVGASLQQELKVPPEALAAYLQRSLDNFLSDPEGALTGPLARGDQRTLERNVAALGDSNLGELFKAFITFHGAEQRRQLERNVS